MRDYKITNFLCDSTYGGWFTMNSIREVNETIIDLLPETLEKHYGKNRNYIIEDIDTKKMFKQYVYIAWLESPFLEGETVHDEECDGFNLFLIGFTDSPENCVEDIYKFGDRVFITKAEPFWE